MVGSGGFRRKQHENQVDRLIIDRFEGNGTLEAGEKAEEALQCGKRAGARDRRQAGRYERLGEALKD